MQITEEDLAPEVVALIDFEMVFGYEPPADLLAVVLRPLPLDWTLRLLSAWGALVNNNWRTDSAIQLRFASDLSQSTPEEGKRLQELLKSGAGIWIHEEQLAVLSRYAFRYCKGRGLPKDALRCMFKALLVFNEQRNRETTTDSEGRGAFLAAELQSIATDGESTYFTIRRYGRFIEWASTEQAKTYKDDWLNIEEDFKTDTGLTVDEYRAAIVALQGHYRGPASVEELHAYDPTPDFDVVFQSMDRRAISDAVKLLSISATEAQTAFANHGESTSMFSVLPFATKPLLEVNPGRYLLPVHRYLLNAAGTGLFYRLSDYYSRTGKQYAFERFHRFFGRFLEEHIREALQNATRNVITGMDGDQPYGQNGASRGSDVYLVFDDVLVIVEVTSSRFNVKKSLFEGNKSALETDLHSMVFKKFEQIRRRYRDWVHGDFEITGVQRSHINKIYAVVVTAQSIPRMIALNARLREGIEPIVEGFDGFEIFETEEVELLERQFPNGDLHLGDLLARKLSTPAGAFRSLTNYLYFFEKNVLIVRPHENVLDDPTFAKPLRIAQQWFHNVKKGNFTPEDANTR